MERPLEDARRALLMYRRLIEQAQDLEHEDLAKATRQLVAVRDRLIAERRRGDGWTRQAQDDLDRVNSLLSVSTSAEFPLVGVRWERLCMLRDALERLIGDWERSTGAAQTARDMHVANV